MLERSVWNLRQSQQDANFMSIERLGFPSRVRFVLEVLRTDTQWARES